MEKRCRLCDEVKSLTEFHRASTARDGHRGECKDCFRAQAAARYRADPERAKKRVRKWQQDHPDRVAATQARYRADGRKKASDRRSHLRRTFGITPEQYDRMLVAQGGGCAICRKPPRDDIALHVDHDHETGAIRKLLCFDCNAGLGKLGDDVELLRAAITYLLEHDPEVVRLGEIARERLAALVA
jgi:hypothetical protein